LPQEQWISQLIEFSKSHPHPPAAGMAGDRSLAPDKLAPDKEEDLECIAWIKVM